jgi:hypothetical protein
VTAARSVSAERGDAGPHESEDAPTGNALTAVAVRWAALGAVSPGSVGRVDAAVAARLATLLRRLAAVLAPSRSGRWRRATSARACW